MKKIALIISLILFMTPVFSLGADISLTALNSPGTSTSDWCAIALLISGEEIDKTEYTNVLKSYITAKYATEEKLSQNKSTEWHRISIVLNLLGEDVTDINGINLINDGIYYRENLGRQGLNGFIWALITLSSGEFDEPVDAINTKNNIISEILKKQNDDGGFSLAAKESSCDITAMAVYALSFYRDRTDVNASVEKAINYLFQMQNEDGSFSENGTPNAESTAQVIVALDAVGISVDDPRFKGIYDALIEFETEDGFSHVLGGEEDTIASYQAMCAMAALSKSEPLYYNKIHKEEKPIPVIEIPTENESEEPADEETTENKTEAETQTEPVTEAFSEPIEEQNNTNSLLVSCFVVILCVTIAMTVISRRKR